jgi:hypothetical protein
MSTWFSGVDLINLVVIAGIEGAIFIVNRANITRALEFFLRKPRRE